MCLWRVIAAAMCAQLLMQNKTVTASHGAIHEYVNKWFFKYRVTWWGLPLSPADYHHSLLWHSASTDYHTCMLILFHWCGMAYIKLSNIGIFTRPSHTSLFGMVSFIFSSPPPWHRIEQGNQTGEFDRWVIIQAAYAQWQEEFLASAWCPDETKNVCKWYKQYSMIFLKLWNHLHKKSFPLPFTTDLPLTT